MKRRATLAVAAIAVGIGYTVPIVTTRPAPVHPSPTPEPVATSSLVTPTTADSAEPTPYPTTTPSTIGAANEPASIIYLVWSSGGLTRSLAEGLTHRFDRVSVVKGDVVELDAPDGSVIPIDALAIDPQAHRPFDPTGSLAPLRPGTVVLGETSAELRHTEIGAEIVIEGREYEIAGTAPDGVVGAAEMVFSALDQNIPVATDRYALVTSADLPRPSFEEEVRSLYEGAPLRIRAEGETTWMRHGDAVLPQVFIKQALGEFSYTDRSGSSFVQERAFLDERIVTATVPILGEIVCHEVVVERLDGAMSELVEKGLAYLVDPTGFAGCWNPRFIRSATGAPAGVSRHAWGAAVDLNANSNLIGSAGTQDPRLIEVMLRWRFTWGGDWLVPDPMHFEYALDPG